jgi:predicted transcriptional regulator
MTSDHLAPTAENIMWYDMYATKLKRVMMGKVSIKTEIATANCTCSRKRLSRTINYKIDKFNGAVRSVNVKLRELMTDQWDSIEEQKTMACAFFHELLITQPRFKVLFQTSVKLKGMRSPSFFKCLIECVTI